MDEGVAVLREAQRGLPEAHGHDQRDGEETDQGEREAHRLLRSRSGQGQAAVGGEPGWAAQHGPRQRRDRPLAGERLHLAVAGDGPVLPPTSQIAEEPEHQRRGQIGRRLGRVGSPSPFASPSVDQPLGSAYRVPFPAVNPPGVR